MNSASNPHEHRAVPATVEPRLRLEQIKARVRTLPGMPGAAVKLLALVDDPAVSLGRIEEILRQDPGLTANVLKLANSAYFGIPARVGSVRQAVMLLGLKRLTHMVIAACAWTLMDRAVPGYDLPAGDLWRHSLAVSVTAEGLVRELQLGAGEEIFTAALLHDVGKIVLGQFLQEGHEGIRAALDQGLGFLDAESMVLGTTHAEIGAEVLASWALPETMVQAVRWHHAPERAGRPDPMLDIVHVANLLCLMLGIGVGREGQHRLPSQAVTRRLGLSTAHLERVASHTLQSVCELALVIEPAYG